MAVSKVELMRWNKPQLLGIVFRPLHWSVNKTYDNKMHGNMHSSSCQNENIRCRPIEKPVCKIEEHASLQSLSPLEKNLPVLVRFTSHSELGSFR